MSNTITARYRITTPMFCGGADNESMAELRLASFKGALRFWWRTLMWRETQDVEELLTREKELFGSHEQKFGQSKVRLRLDQQDNATRTAVTSDDRFSRYAGKGAYYLGYGVMDFRGQWSRPALAGGKFTVQVKYRPSKDSDRDAVHIKQIQNALILLGTLGGMGSKSRKGYGSLTLTDLKCGEEKFNLSDDPGKRLVDVLGTSTSDSWDCLPEWTAWSGLSRVVTLTSNLTSPIALLNEMGVEMVLYRSWHPETVQRGATRDPNFPFGSDHDLCRTPSHSITTHPKRVAFGLPHNYYVDRTAKHVEPSTCPGGAKLDRRSSPLFLHIHQVSEDVPPIGVATFLPARFLPEGTKIKTFGKDVPLDSGATFWEPLTEFMNRLQGTGKTSKQTSLVGKEVSLG